MASLAQIDDFYDTPAGVSSAIGRFLVTDTEFKPRVAPLKPHDTRLRAGIKLEYSGELSPHIESAIARVAELERREVGWDSHGGRRLNDRAVHPAFKLIIDGCKMCHHPRIQLNGEGNLDLIWESESRYLEITARADGTYEVSYEDGGSGEEYESEGPVGYKVAQDYLTRFCAIP